MKKPMLITRVHKGIISEEAYIEQKHGLGKKEILIF